MKSLAAIAQISLWKKLALAGFAAVLAFSTFVGLADSNGDEATVLVQNLDSIDGFVDRSPGERGLVLADKGKGDLYKGAAPIYQEAMTPPVGAIPEPGTWAMMILGFAMSGAAVRHHRRNNARRDPEDALS